MKKGFTLAEILITLGIVGVVAVLTLPNMIKNHQKRVMVTQLQRTYNAIENAMPAYLDEVHATKLYDTDAFNGNRNTTTIENDEGTEERYDSSALAEFVKNNFKTSKICTENTNGETNACFGSEYRSIQGDVINEFNGDVCAILKTGATVCFCSQWEADDFPFVNIDVNGPQGPNVWGRDAYQLEMNNAGEIAESFGDLQHTGGNHHPDNCGENAYGSGCFNKIVEEGWKMDY